MTQVLLMDNQFDMCALVRDLLKDDGYAILETPTSDTALSILRCSADACVVHFGMTMGTSLLQAAVDEPVVRGHAFVLFTATPKYLTPL